jgi:erythromycin esterase-like protein
VTPLGSNVRSGHKIHRTSHDYDARSHAVPPHFLTAGKYLLSAPKRPAQFDCRVPKAITLVTQPATTADKSLCP